VLDAAQTRRDRHARSRAHTRSLALLCTRACTASCTRHDAHLALRPSWPDAPCRAPFHSYTL
jgi:hypothetical protein